jgi:hypothetical protein
MELAPLRLPQADASRMDALRNLSSLFRIGCRMIRVCPDGRSRVSLRASTALEAAVGLLFRVMPSTHTSTEARHGD